MACNLVHQVIQKREDCIKHSLASESQIDANGNAGFQGITGNLCGTTGHGVSESTTPLGVAIRQSKGAIIALYPGSVPWPEIALASGALGCAGSPTELHPAADLMRRGCLAKGRRWVTWR